MDQSPAISFWEAIEVEGLMVDAGSDNYFSFDLDGAKLVVSRTRVMRVIELARKHLDTRGRGELHKLLRLGVKRSNLTDSKVFWDYWYNGPDKITLGDWLRGNGINPSVFTD